jgi:Right handed beta helix region
VSVSRKHLVGITAACAAAVLLYPWSPAADAGSAHPAGVHCTLHAATVRAAQAAKPGDVVCFPADLSGHRLVVSKGGTPGRPVSYSGDGRAVDGITIEADHVVVEGFRADHPTAPGIELTGTDITVRGNTVTSPQGGDGDGLRFFGDDLRIVDNRISDTANTGGRHADCLQTFASDTPASHHVLIEGNRCERVDNMCLMAEGPDDGEGDGHGTTSDFVIRNNYCDTREASQTLMFEDVQHTTITGNTFAGATDHAIGLALHSTGAHVGGNTLDPHIGYEVGIDDSSRPGYQGPDPGGEP